MTAINGNTGNVAGTGIVGILNTWSATISRATSDVTSFTNSGRNRLLGVYDLTGSAGGVLTRTASFISGHFLAAQTADSGASITLTARSDTVSTNTIQFTAVCSEVSMQSNKAGDTSVTFNFSLASTVTGTNSPFTLVWSA
jgi:hypothetical protein